MKRIKKNKTKQTFGSSWVLDACPIHSTHLYCLLVFRALAWPRRTPHHPWQTKGWEREGEKKKANALHEKSSCGNSEKETPAQISALFFSFI